MGSIDNLNSPIGETADFTASANISRKGSINVTALPRKIEQESFMHHHQTQMQSTTEMFKDMLTQKKHTLFSKLAPSDSDNASHDSAEVLSVTSDPTNSSTFSPQTISCRSTGFEPENDIV